VKPWNLGISMQLRNDVDNPPTSKQQRQPSALAAEASSQLQQTHFTHEITSQRPLHPERRYLRLWSVFASIPRLLGVESAGM